MKTEFIRGVGEGSLTGDMTGYISITSRKSFSVPTVKMLPSRSRWQVSL